MRFLLWPCGRVTSSGAGGSSASVPVSWTVGRARRGERIPWVGDAGWPVPVPDVRGRQEPVGISAIVISRDVDLLGVGRLEAVVKRAGQGEGVDVGGTVAEGPAGDVVDFAQRSGHFAAVYGAGRVQRLENLALARAGEPDGAAEIEGDATASEDQCAHSCREGDTAGLFGRDGCAIGQAPGCPADCERLQVGDVGDLGGTFSQVKHDHDRRLLPL